METHIWHAKRFHMTRDGGYGHVLPVTPTDKCWRQTFKALTRGCIMWDSSYHKLVQICGDKSELISQLNTLTSADTDQVFEHGPGEKQATLYHPGEYPGGVVGSIKYCWRPRQSDDETDTMWLWCHPAFHEEVVKLLKQSLSLEEIVEDTEMIAEETVSESIEDKSPIVQDKIGEIKLKPKSLPSKTMINSSGVMATFLENKLNRLQLKGPKSLDVVRDTFEFVKDTDSIDKNSSLSQYYSQKVIDQTILKSENFHPGTMLGVIVEDPRRNIPVHKEKIEESNNVKTVSEGLSSSWSLQESGLWSEEVRHDVSHHKLSDFEINKQRQSDHINHPNIISLVPVMLVVTEQGCDLIIPPGWCMAFWMRLVYAGVKVGGLQEMKQCELESETSSSAEFEDSGWMRTESARRSEEMRRKYFQFPPDKRPNYNVLGTLSPFSRPWSSLTGHQDWFVLRDTAVLNKLRERRESVTLAHTERALVVVNLKIEGKGRLSENTGIYHPLDCDLETDDFCLEEPKHNDDHESKRKETRSQHQSRLKQLKRQAKKIRQKRTQLLLETAAAGENFADHDKAETIEVSLKALKGLCEEEKSTFKDTNERLWESESYDKLRDHNCRTLIGWVVDGGYSLRQGGEVGVGLISLSSVNNQIPLRVLTRQPDNSSFRFASLKLS